MTQLVTYRLRSLDPVNDNDLISRRQFTWLVPFRSVGRISGKHDAVICGSFTHDKEWGMASVCVAPRMDINYIHTSYWTYYKYKLFFTCRSVVYNNILLSIQIVAIGPIVV